MNYLTVCSLCSMVYTELFRMLGWHQVALLAEHGQEFPEYQAFLKDTFLANGMSVVFDRKMPRQATFEDAKKVRVSWRIVDL